MNWQGYIIVFQPTSEMAFENRRLRTRKIVIGDLERSGKRGSQGSSSQGTGTLHRLAAIFATFGFHNVEFRDSCIRCFVLGGHRCIAVTYTTVTRMKRADGQVGTQPHDLHVSEASHLLASGLAFDSLAELGEPGIRPRCLQLFL